LIVQKLLSQQLTRLKQRIQIINLQNDIALLVFHREFELNEAIKTICLPPPGMSFEGQRCFVSGWGKDKIGKKEFTRIS
jgi:hypothetical protein